MTGGLPQELLGRAERVLDACRDASLKLATVESCTGGLIAACLTAIPGSSDVLERGFVTYSNAAKTALVGVPALLLAEHGAVSEPVARAMAEGALTYAPVDLAVAVTGIAGPGGGSHSKPVGLVHLAAARNGRSTLHARLVLPGNRTEIREASAAAALDLLLRLI